MSKAEATLRRRAYVTPCVCVGGGVRVSTEFSTTLDNQRLTLTCKLLKQLVT